MFPEAVVIASDRAGADVRLGTNLRVSDIAKVGNLCTFADDRFFHFHEISGTRAILQVRSRSQAGEWSDDGVIVQAAVDRNAVWFDQDVVTQDHIAEHTAGANGAALAN